MNRQKMMALVAHDNMKHDLAEWVDWNCEKLSKHRIVCTGTTGKIVEETLLNHSTSHHYEQPALDITRLKSGPLGGDQQLGALIADERISALIFFWDPMSAQRPKRQFSGSTKFGPGTLPELSGHAERFGRPR